MKKLIFIFVMCLTFLLTQRMSMALKYYSFGDDVNYWDGWADTYNDGTHARSNYNNQDVVGTPNLTGGQIITDDSGKLLEIAIFYSSIGSDYSIGDLFIDLNDDSNWDYIVHNTYDTNNNHWKLSSTNSTLYKVNGTFSANKGDNDNYYFTSNDTWNGGHNGTSFRNDHPTVIKYSYISQNAPNLLTKKGKVTVKDFNHSSNDSGNVTFDFSGLGLDLTNGRSWWGAVIAAQPVCANDADKGKVPEPATVLLIGFGLLGIGLCSNNKIKKRS